MCWHALVNPGAEKAETGGSLGCAGQPPQPYQSASGQWETDRERLSGTSCLEPGTVPGLPRPLLLHASLLCSVPCGHWALNTTKHLSSVTSGINLAYSAIRIQFSVCFCPQQGSQGAEPKTHPEGLWSVIPWGPKPTKNSKNQQLPSTWAWWGIPGNPSLLRLRQEDCYLETRTYYFIYILTCGRWRQKDQEFKAWEKQMTKIKLIN